MTLLHVLSTVLLGVSLAGILYQLTAAATVRGFARRRADPRGSQLPVTILKPLHGCDDQLYENLLSFCQQDHPCFQVVFGVRDPADPAIGVVRRLMAELPGHDLELVIDGRVYGTNYKVSNLQNIWRAAKYDILVIADSDMRVGPDYLNRVTAPLDEEGVGLVTCLYVGQAGHGAWSRMHAAWINYFFLPSAILADRMGARGCFGATLALTRDMLERVGGFAMLTNKLADDYELGAAVERQGCKTVLASYLVDNYVAQSSIASLWKQELRWARTIRSIVPLGHIGSIITHTAVLATVAALLAGFSEISLGILAAALASRLAVVVLIDRMLGLEQNSPLAIAQRELISVSILIASFFGRRVAWRDRVFLVDANGRLTPEGKIPR